MRTVPDNVVKGVFILSLNTPVRIMNTVTESIVSLYRSKGSKFLGRLCPAPDRNHFEAFLTQVKGEHPLATHHCWAWRIGIPEPEEFAQDDGEPPGTAGTPILNQLRAAELTHAACIVIRYYGGTKLGKPGLIEAYGETARLCIEAATIQPVTPVRLIRIGYHYPDQGLIDSWKHRYGLIEKQAEYTDDVTLTLACPLESSVRLEQEIKSAAHKLLHVKILGESWIPDKTE